jgi:hypothetical protein
MKTLTILLPDAVNQLVLREAAKQNVDAAALCSGIIAEHFLDARDTLAVPRAERPATISGPLHRWEPTDTFGVREHFPNCPTRSVELAQEFVNEALKIPGTKAFKDPSGRGIGIKPNFVWIQYLQKRHPGGIGLSFYGRPQDHLHPSLLRPGRNPNYSKSIVCTQEGLKPLLEEVKRSHELKFGRRG